ncbi:MAG: transglycosylase SLT domain-containing protein [Bacteroidia bacterium]|nr:transglycosylase SLT domain-containing protein [Bacteroidia bacterium]
MSNTENIPSFRKTAFRKAGPGVLLFLIFIGVYFFLKVYVYPPTQNGLSYTNNNFYVFDLNIPANLEFCGERIPSNDFDIRKDLEKEFFTSAYWKNNSLALFTRAQRWFPYIEPILKQEGVPDDFKYLCVIESHLSNASSHAGAAGFWQLVPVSAQNYGLEVNACVDERYHVEKATRAACRHIKDAYAIFNNWTLSAAAYNRGIGGIQNAMAKQKGTTYYDLLLNKETGSFVYRILAYKTLFSSPGHFGIKKKKWYYFSKIPYKIYKVDSSIHNLNDFARLVGCTSGMIRLHNPWLLCEKLDNPAKKVYEIRVPKKMEADYSGYLKDLLPESGNLVQYAEDPVKLQHASTDTLAANTRTMAYLVKINEPLKNLATFLKVDEADIRQWNHLDEKQEAVAGQTLLIKYSTK